jgi:Ion channel
MPTPPNNGPNIRPPRSSRVRGGLGRFSAVETLIAIVVLFFATPFIEGMPGGKPIETLLWAVFLVSAVLAVGARRRTLLVAALLAVPTLVGHLLNRLHPQNFSAVLFLVGGLAFFAFVIVHFLRFVLRARRVTSEVLCASITAYLMLGMLWALAYRLVATANPAAFSFNIGQAANEPLAGFTAFYFSFVTLSTLGYGDITPVSSIARSLSVMEAMTGTLYMAVLVARLVSLYSMEPPTPNASDQSED